MGIFKKSKQNLKQINLIREEGYPVELKPKRKTYNELSYYSKDSYKYFDIFQNFDFQQRTALYKWSEENLPNGITGEMIERMLYWHGSICAFMFLGKIYMLPWVLSGELNIYGLPSKIRPIPFAGKDSSKFFSKDFSLSIDSLGNKNENYSAVLLFDSTPQIQGNQPISRAYYNTCIIEDMANVLARININIVVSNKKIFLQVKDANQADIVREELNQAFGNDSPFAIITSPLDINSVQSSSDFNADELFSALKNYDAIRCMFNGVSSSPFGNDKKERLITDEVKGSTEEKDLIKQLGLDYRKRFCEMCNKKFGTNMSVELRIKEDINNYSNNQFDNEEGDTNV